MLSGSDIGAIATIGIPIIASSALIIAGFYSNLGRRAIVLLNLIFGIAELGAIAFLSYFSISGLYSSALNGVIVLDGFSIIPLLIGAFVLQIILASLSLEGEVHKAAIFAVAGFSTVLGSFLLATTSSISLFIASWLLLSISSYTAVAAAKTKSSSDAALKYALMGVLSTVFIVMWLGTGAYLAGDNIYSANWFGSGKLFLLSAALLLAGVGFKLGIFPFHWWMPDVYSQAEGRAIALITGVAKIGAVLGFVRMIYYTFYIGPSAQFIDMVAIVSIFTMTFGNIAALTTRVLPRILAYSSIAQIGYILVGVVGILYGASSGNAQLIYLASGGIAIQTLGYSLAKSGSFLFSGELGSSVLDESIKGAYRADALSSLSFSIFLLSLLGLPPLVGFWGKLYLFESAVPYSLALVVIAIINSGISSYYYGRLISMLFSQTGTGKGKFGLRVSYVILSIVLVALGLGLLQLIFPYLSIKVL